MGPQIGKEQQQRSKVTKNGEIKETIRMLNSEKYFHSNNNRTFDSIKIQRRAISEQTLPRIGQAD